MTAPPLPPPVDWRAVLVAGVAAVYGITATADQAAPTGCCLGEVDCPDGHLWVALVQRCVWEAQA